MIDLKKAVLFSSGDSNISFLAKCLADEVRADLVPFIKINNCDFNKYNLIFIGLKIEEGKLDPYYKRIKFKNKDVQIFYFYPSDTNASFDALEKKLVNNMIKGDKNFYTPDFDRKKLCDNIQTWGTLVSQYTV